MQLGVTRRSPDPTSSVSDYVHSRGLSRPWSASSPRAFAWVLSTPARRRGLAQHVSLAARAGTDRSLLGTERGELRFRFHAASDTGGRATDPAAKPGVSGSFVVLARKASAQGRGHAAGEDRRA